MDWTVEIMKQLLEIVKQGGVYALWALVAFWIIYMVKLLIIVIAFYKIFILVIRAINNYITIKCITNKEKIALLSKECSDKVSSILEEYSASQEKHTKDFIEEAKKLLAELKDCQTKK